MWYVNYTWIKLLQTEGCIWKVTSKNLAIIAKGQICDFKENPK